MKLTLITDAWFPQVNGVVRTLDTVIGHLKEQGVDVDILSPEDFKTYPCPTYPEIRLALFPGSVIRERISTFQPDAIHIATEGPLGFSARRFCKRHDLAFTTAYHTKFPEYVNLRTGLPLKWLYGLMRRFHNASSAVMVATRSIALELESHGIKNIKSWSRGVDLELFKPYPKDGIEGLNHLPRPFLLYVGRVAVEKNINAFLDLDVDGTKIVIGDGPQLESLQKEYPDVQFLGKKTGEELARHYAIGDVFVFPSRTDTFGLVNLEALASGVPVAAYPVPGPIDIIGAKGHGTRDDFDQAIGAVNEDLSLAVQEALKCQSEDCRTYAEFYSWGACAKLFTKHLVPTNGENTLSKACAQIHTHNVCF